MMKKLLFLLLFVAMFLSAASAQVCKSGEVDMLPLMAPQIATLNGHYNVVVPNVGRFYWVKAKIGYPWDVDPFDRSFIYQSITEVDWNNLSTYKKFHTAMPWM